LNRVRFDRSRRQLCGELIRLHGHEVQLGPACGLLCKVVLAIQGVVQVERHPDRLCNRCAKCYKLESSSGGLRAQLLKAGDTGWGHPCTREGDRAR
jgi:hypothetical protein